MGALISAEELAALSPRPTILDVRWELGKPSQRGAYEAGHIPGAAFVDLECELSGPPSRGGRHPLPETGAFQAAMRAAGVSNDRPVIVYDASGASAARAWWLLRYFGHDQVAVLDGGLETWNGPLETGPSAIQAG